MTKLRSTEKPCVQLPSSLHLENVKLKYIKLRNTKSILQQKKYVFSTFFFPESFWLGLHTHRISNKKMCGHCWVISVTHLTFSLAHKLPLAHMCSDTFGCTSSVPLSKAGTAEAGCLCAWGLWLRAHPPDGAAQCCFNRGSCDGVEQGCVFLWWVTARTGRSASRRWACSRPCLILHLLRGVHLETLFGCPLQSGRSSSRGPQG